MQYKTKGIILKRTNLGEADRILTIFTETHGKIKAIAKGVRKTLSKLAGHLEPFCLVNLGIAEGKNLDVITDATNIKCFIKLRGNLDKTNIAYFIAEMIETMTGENEKHLEIYELLNNTFEHLNNNNDRLLLSYFELNFLAESGFKPELQKCLVCNKKIISGKNYYHFEVGGLACENCRGDVLISDKAIKILRLFLKHKITLVEKLKIDKKLTLEVENIIDRYLKYIAQKEFKSKRFLKAA